MTIVQRTFNLIPDKELSIGNAEYLREMQFGSNWTRLRIGILMAQSGFATNNVSGCALQLGVCSKATPFANTTGYGSATTTNYIGCDFISKADSTGVPGTWIYNAGSGGNDRYSQTYCAAVRRVVAVRTFQVTGSATGIVPTNVGTLPRRGFLFCDITKGSPNYTIQPYMGTTTSSVVDSTPAEFLDSLEMPGDPTILGNAMIKHTAAVITCSEVAGAFDTLSLYSNRAAFPTNVALLACFRQS